MMTSLCTAIGALVLFSVCVAAIIGTICGLNDWWGNRSQQLINLQNQIERNHESLHKAWAEHERRLIALETPPTPHRGLTP